MSAPERRARSTRQERDYAGQIAGNLLSPMPVAPAWGSSFVGDGFKKHLLGWPLPECK